MANVKYYDVILKPVVTEKSMAAMGEKKYTFLVHTDANKTMIKEAVEKMFEGTKVKSVNTCLLYTSWTVALKFMTKRRRIPMREEAAAAAQQ